MVAAQAHLPLSAYWSIWGLERTMKTTEVIDFGDTR